MSIDTKYNEIYEYIINGKDFISPPCKNEFTEKYPMQNGGILGEDAYAFAKQYNDNIYLVQDETVKTNSDDMLLYVLNGSHMIYIHKDEVYDSSQFQQTSNNCTLWAAIIAVIRPCVKDYDEMINIIEHITQEQLQKISKHFFGRDKHWFKYIKTETPFHIKLNRGINGGATTPPEYVNTIKNWLGHMSKNNFHIHHLITTLISNPAKYYELQDKYRNYNKTNPDEIRKDCEGKSRIERAYIHCKVRNINPIYEFENIQRFIRSRETVQKFPLYRTEITNRFDFIHKGDLFYNNGILTTTPSKEYAMMYITKYTTGEDTGNKILLIFPEERVKSTCGKLDEDEHTTYVQYENIFSNKVVGTSAENTIQVDEFWINPSTFEVIDESIEDDIKILVLKQIF